uniref:Uncharacterized protein n=1 Tax=Rhizophora mucronata TaxID=61149 RepID=A0A2P2Q9A5_RHIMU
MRNYTHIILRMLRVSHSKRTNMSLARANGYWKRTWLDIQIVICSWTATYYQWQTYLGFNSVL